MQREADDSDGCDILVKSDLGGPVTVLYVF